MKKTILLAAISLAGFSIVTSASAQSLLIDWGGDYVTANRDLVLPAATNNGTIRTWSYSNTAAISPASGNYTGPAFYGALQTNRTGTSPGPTNFGQAQVVNSVAGDRITLSLSGSAGIDTAIQGLVFFNKSDFLNLSSSPISFNSTSSARLSWTSFGGDSGSGIRAAVLDGSTWYLSQSVGSGFTSNLTISNLAAQNFASWNPTGSPLNPTPVSFTTAGSSFTDIQGVGFYFDISRIGNNSQFAMLDIEFSAIPEPTTWALLAAGLTAIVALRRRRQV